MVSTNRGILGVFACTAFSVPVLVVRKAVAGLPFGGRDGIETAKAPGVASKKPQGGQVYPPEESMSLESHPGIFAAGGIIPAGWRKERADEELISAYELGCENPEEAIHGEVLLWLFSKYLAGIVASRSLTALLSETVRMPDSIRSSNRTLSTYKAWSNFGQV